jgi:aminoglycoside phosphotransferase
MRVSFKRAAGKRQGPSVGDFLEAILRERPDLRKKTAYFPKQGLDAHTVIIGSEVFKGPRLGFASRFDREHEILKAMEGKGLPVPKVTYVGKETIFFGMAKLPGVVLEGNRLMRDQQRLLAKDIVDFCMGMACAAPKRNGKFAMHTDLHAGNILINPKTKRLSGVIDFGVIGYFRKDPFMYYFSHKLNMMIWDEYDRRKADMLSYRRKPVSSAAKRHL